MRTSENRIEIIENNSESSRLAFGVRKWQARREKLLWNFFITTHNLFSPFSRSLSLLPPLLLLLPPSISPRAREEIQIVLVKS
jgi:hypothetical protein